MTLISKDPEVSTPSNYARGGEQCLVSTIYLALEHPHQPGPMPGPALTLDQ